MGLHSHPGRENILADAISIIFMGSVEHVEEERKDLPKDFDRLALLGLCIINISGCGVMVENGEKSSSLVEVKGK